MLVSDVICTHIISFTFFFALCIMHRFIEGIVIRAIAEENKTLEIKRIMKRNIFVRISYEIL